MADGNHWRKEADRDVQPKKKSIKKTVAPRPAEGWQSGDAPDQVRPDQIPRF